jgi:hypothetical protein
VLIALASVASPVEVPLFAGAGDFPRGWIGLREYVVTAPGRAATRVWIDPTEGGMRTYALPKEAQLVVRTRIEATQAARYEVQIARGARSDVWAVEPVPPEGTVHFRGLPAGSWTARLALVDAPLDRGFAVARAELEAGETQTVDVDPAPANEVVETTDVRGTLRLPEDVDPRSIRIAFAPGRLILDAWDRRVEPEGIPRPPDVDGDLLFADPRDPRLFHWYACRAPAGEWQVSIRALHWSKPVVFDDDEPVELVVESIADPFAPPIETVVRFVDGPSGRELGKADVDVSVAGAGWSIRCAVGETRWRVVTSSPRFRLAVARVGAERVKSEFHVDGTSGDVMLTLWPRQPIELRVYDGDARVGSPEIVGELVPSAVPIGHAGRAICVSGTTMRDNTTYYCVEGPGRYRVALRGDARYAPTEEVEVVVESGAPPPVAVFRLVRKAR